MVTEFSHLASVGEWNKSGEIVSQAHMVKKILMNYQRRTGISVGQTVNIGMAAVVLHYGVLNENRGSGLARPQ